MAKDTGIYLTQQQLQMIDEKLLRIHDLLPSIDKMEACGMECRGAREDLASVQQFLTSLKANFSPHVRP